MSATVAAYGLVIGALIAVGGVRLWAVRRPGDRGNPFAVAAAVVLTIAVGWALVALAGAVLP
ncbi:hypothetical protein PO878_00345 [Iamia majanohamensis]|uniref:Uncharacterized protein n=1 Tax=Iamia majanohamensis TaxID=467976 RepID=A0AAE9Y7M0_9ACTN|nr:hypothetical protein [Iamia majanohamensis]WCO67171.1 hypothetical protein PO878_00345 [Iamia majanohamensis]